MNLNTVYLPHFCRPCYHKKSLMDLIMLLIAHIVLLTSFANGFVIRNSLNSSDAQIPTNQMPKSNFNRHHHHQTTVMPSKSVTYELTVINDSIPELNQTHHNLAELTKTNSHPTKTNHQETKTGHQATKTNPQEIKNSYESSKTHHESSKTHHEPSKTHHEPSKTHHEPSKTHHEPSKTHKEPSQTYHNPTKTNFESIKTSHQPSKTSQLDQLDKLNQEQIDQLNQVKYLNQLNKVNISPINIISTISSIGHANVQHVGTHGDSGGVKGQVGHVGFDTFAGIKDAQQMVHGSDPFSLKGSFHNQVNDNRFGTKGGQQNQINDKFGTKGSLQIHNAAFGTKQQSSISNQFSTTGQPIQLNDPFDVKGQPIQLNNPFGVKGHPIEANNPFGIKGAQQQLSDLSGVKGGEPSKTNFLKPQNEVRDGFVVLTSAHNSNYPAPMFSRNMLSQLGSNDQNDFYQKYYTSTSLVTIRPIVKEYHQQQIDQQIYEKINQEKIQDEQHPQIVVQGEIKGQHNYQSLNSSNFLGNSAFLPEDKPEEDTELDAVSGEHKPPLMNEFNTLNDDGSGKTFFELFGNGITSYNLHKMNSSFANKPVTSGADQPTGQLAKPQPAYLGAYDNKTLFNSFDSTTTTAASVFDLTAEDSNYRPFISNDPDPIQNRPKAHGTRPGQPLTSYDLFKEFPLINNSNIIINQFHSTPTNWSKPAERENQTKIISIHSIDKDPALSLPTELNFLHPFLANYSALTNTTSFIRPTIITEFANEFFTNLTNGGPHFNDNHDLDNSDSSGIAAFLNFSTSTTQAPIGTLDRNQFDIPLPEVWNSVANQLTSTTLSPLSVYPPISITHYPFGNFQFSNSSSLPGIPVSAASLVTGKNNHTGQEKPFPHFKNPYPSTTTLSPILNHTPLISLSHNDHHSQPYRLPNTAASSSALYSAAQTSAVSHAQNANSKNGSTATPFYVSYTTTSTSTPSTITPEIYHLLNSNLNGNSMVKQPNGNFIDRNMTTTLTNNHNIDESIFYNNPLRLATNPKIMHPLTFLIMSYLASKSSIGANLITRNDQPSNSTAASNRGLVDWLRTGRRRKRKNASSSSRSNKQVNRQQKQRNTNSNGKLSSVNGLTTPSFQIAPVLTLQDVLLSNHLSNKLAGAANSLAQAFPTPIAPLTNPLFFPTTKSSYATAADRFPTQMIYETKRDRPSSNFALEDFLNEGFTADDYEAEIKSLIEPLGHLRSNSKILNNDGKTLNKNSGSSSTSYRTHRNSQQNVNSRNSRTPPEISGSSGSNINTPTANSLESDRDRGHSTANTPAPRCDRFTSSICVDDFEYPEAAIIEEIDRKRNLFQLLYSEVKGDTWSQVDGLTRSQEQALSWDQFGSNGFANDTSNESYSSSDRSPHRNSYLTMDDDLMNNEPTAFQFSSLVKDSNQNSKKSGFICSSEILYGRPKLAKNTKNQWKVIVNAGTYTQTVRMEKCLQPKKACSLVQSAAAAMGATSRCAQVNAFHRLMVFEKGKGFYIDTFRIPSSCACYVQHKSKEPTNVEFDSDEVSSNPHRKTNRKRTDGGNPQTTNKAEIDRQTSNRLQHTGLSNLPTSLFNQPFILSDLNNLQRNKLQVLFPTFGQRTSALGSANNLISSKLSPNVELRPLHLKNGGTLLASLVPLYGNNHLKSGGSSNLNANNSLIERLSISGSLTPAMQEQQQRELSQLLLDFLRQNAVSLNAQNDQFKMFSLEDLIKKQLSLAQVTPDHLLEQLNNEIFNPTRLNEVTKNANRRRNTLKNGQSNADGQKITLGLLLGDTNSNNAKLKALPVKLVQAVPITSLNNQLIYGQRFVDKRKSGIAQMMMANKSNYSNLLTKNLLNGHLLNNNLLNTEKPLIIQRDNALSLGTPLTALKLMNPGNLITQSPMQAVTDSKEKADEEKEASDEDPEDDDEKMIEEIDAGNLLGDMEDQEDKEDGRQGGEMYAESNQGESSEDPNSSKADPNAGPNEHPANEERLSNNELNDEDKENTSNETGDHDRANELDDSKSHNYRPSLNHLDTNSSLFTFENVSNGPRRKAFSRLSGQPKSNNSFVSVSGFANRHDSSKFDEFRNTFKETMGYATETSLTNRPHKYDEEHYSLQHENALHPSNEGGSQSSSSTTMSYLDDHSANEWSGSLSSSTIFTPTRAFKRKYNSTTNTTALSDYSVDNKRKLVNEDQPRFGYKPHLTLATDEQANGNQLTAPATGSDEQTSNQNVERLAIEESENDLRNQTLSSSSNNGRRPANDRPISELLSEKVNFNYHPILDFMKRKD